MTSTNSSPAKFRQKVEWFLEQMTSVFKKPYDLTGDRVAISLRNYGEVLEAYDDAVLAELWQRARVRFSGAWPSLKDLTDVAGEVSSERFSPEDEKILTEREIMNSPNGRAALKERLGNSFLLECQRQKRIVDGKEEFAMFLKEEIDARDKFKPEDFGRFTEFVMGARKAAEAHESRLQQVYG